MKHPQNYGDERQLLQCVFCGGPTQTVDHCPSRVLLDEPYPEQLPTVPACLPCNNSFSLDEEYLACLVACVLAGSTDPDNVTRPKIRRILNSSPALRARIDQQKNESANGIVFQPEMPRVESVVTKLAKGHALFELNEPCLGEPDLIQIVPVELMTQEERQNFELPEAPAGWPEAGSRAMQRMLIMDEASLVSPWVVIQNGLYRYHAAAGAAISVQIMIAEYLACKVSWD